MYKILVYVIGNMDIKYLFSRVASKYDIHFDLKPKQEEEIAEQAYKTQINISSKLDMEKCSFCLITFLIWSFLRNVAVYCENVDLVESS